MLTDGAATSATGGSPVFTSASYNFVSGNVGAWVYIASGTNWRAGWYQIASVASNAATLSAAIGAAITSIYQANTVAGVASTASPTGATWSINYSQQASAQIAYTNIVIGATTTQGTSVAHPFGKQLVGNILNITSGTGFSVQRVCLQSVSTVTATFDKTLGSAASTGGTGNLGGACATLATPRAVSVAGNALYLKNTGTLTVTTGLAEGASLSVGRPTQYIGYYQTRADIGFSGGVDHRPTWTTATNSVNLVNFAAAIGVTFANMKLTCTAGTPGYGFRATNSNNCVGIAFVNCYFSGWIYAINGDFNVDFGIAGLLIDSCEVTGCTSDGIRNYGTTVVLASYIHGNTANGLNIIASGSCSPFGLQVMNSVIKSNGAAGINAQSQGLSMPIAVIQSALINNTTSGLIMGGTNQQQQLSLWNCIIDSNGAFGVNFSVGSSSFWWGPNMRNNAYGSGGTANTSGNIGGGPFMDASDVILTGDPFTNRSGGNFTLNNTAGAGAACKGTGYPLVVPG